MTFPFFATPVAVIAALKHHVEIVPGYVGIDHIHSWHVLSGISRPMPIPKLIQAARWEIDEDQATWVRQTFAWYVDGKSPRWIAGHLNRLGIPAPRRDLPANDPAELLHVVGHSSAWRYAARDRHPHHRKGYLESAGMDRESRNQAAGAKDAAGVGMDCEQPTLRIVEQRIWDLVQARRRGQPHQQRREGDLSFFYPDY